MVIKPLKARTLFADFAKGRRFVSYSLELFITVLGYGYTAICRSCKAEKRMHCRLTDRRTPGQTDKRAFRVAPSGMKKELKRVTWLPVLWAICFIKVESHVSLVVMGQRQSGRVRQWPRHLWIAFELHYHNKNRDKNMIWWRAVSQLENSP